MDAHSTHSPDPHASPGHGQLVPASAVHDSSAHGHAAHGHADHGPFRPAKYVYVVLALCILSTMSFLTYSDMWPTSLDTPAVKRLFMMAVSCAKAMLVILFFMHLKYEANWKYVLTVPASIMSMILIILLIPDIGMRVKGAFNVGGKYSQERLEFVADETDAQTMLRASTNAAHDGEHPGSEPHRNAPSHGER